jgi:hypothetical protein
MTGPFHAAFITSVNPCIHVVDDDFLAFAREHNKQVLLYAR